jgi:intracellular sulfur oxidation DsrE/DsrF family protein
MQTLGAWPLACLFAVLSVTSALAAETAPWGKGKPQNMEYAPQRVVYDVAVSDSAALSIVLVLHGDEIPLFAIENYAKHKELMVRAQSLTVGGTIEFRMCRIAARGHGFDPQDIHGFVQIVPMADAEIVRLQQEEGYAYMQ